MKLIILTALVAVCHTAKLDRTYLPPPSAATAGGNHNSLQAPLIKTSEAQVSPPSDTPIGSYTNEFQGVVVDAAAPGTRASSDHLSGLGAPRPSYGSIDSKVGEAAFRGSAFQGHGNDGTAFQGNAGASDLKPERPQASKDRNSNILTYSNDVNPDAYSYGFETDNGIAVGENGIAANGIQAEGGYSYQGDDGQMYKVTYVADEMGYRPQGAHLPTPPPIPEEILKSLQQNAQEEAAGIVDDGSYDAQKYNGDYTHHKAADIAHNGAQLSQFGNRPDASTSGSFINQNNQDLGNRFGSQTQAQLNHGNQFGVNTHHIGVQGLSGIQGSQSHGVPTGPSHNQFGQQTSQFGLTNNFNGQASQFGAQMQSTRPSGSQFGSHSQSNQGSQFGAQTQSLEASGPQFGSQVQSTQSPGSIQSQFGSQSTFSSGNKFGSQPQHSQSSGSQIGAQAQYTHQSGFPRPQFGSQVQSAQSSGTQFEIQGQATRPSQIGAHTQATHSHPFRPQFGNPPQFGLQSNIQTKPQHQGSSDASASYSFSQTSVTPSPVSGNQFNGQNVNKPFDIFSSNQFPSQNQQNNKFGASSSSSNMNRFPLTPNRFGSNNEYLPPFNNVVSKPQFGSANTFNNRPSQYFDSQTQAQEFQQSFGFATSSKPNTFQSQTPSRPGQFSSNSQSSQSQLISSQSPLNSQTISNTKPTSIPDTEITTPLEPNDFSTSSQSAHNSQTTTNFGSSPSFSGSKPNTGSSKPNFEVPSSSFGSSTFGSSSSTFGSSAPGFDSLKPSFGSVSSNFGGSSSTFGSPTSNFGSTKPSFGSTTSQGGYNKQPSNQFSHSQQFNTQENLSSGSQTFSTTAPNSQPQTSDFQSGSNKQGNNGRPQFQQNSFNQNQFNQKPDDSYYYNQPSKPFNIPQGSTFPSSPSYQTNVNQNSQIGSQLNSFPKVPGTPVSSSPGSQLTQNQGSSTTVNGITQAAISPFPSVSPTLSTQFGTTQNNQFSSKPSFSQMTFSQSQSSTNQPSRPSRPQFQTTQNDFSNSQTDSPNQPTVQNQQYEGTIYEYNKPAETQPSSQSDSASSQTIQSNIVSSKPEENRPTTSQITTKPTQVTNFEQNSYTQSQQSNFNQGNLRPQFGSQSNNVPNRFGQATQFESQASSQPQSSQPTISSDSESSQTNSIGLSKQPLGSTGSGYLGYPSAQDSKPQFGSNFGEISQYPTVGHPSIQQSNYNTFRGDQKGQNTNEQNLGSNTKPHVSQNQFGHDSQSAQSVTTQTDFPPELVQNQGILSSISQRETFNQQQAAQAQASSIPENQSSQLQQNTQISYQTDQSNVEPDSKPFPDTAVLSVVPSPPSKPFLPQTSAQAVVSSEPLDFLPLSTPQNQFKQPSSLQPTQPSRFPSFQGSSVQGISGKGEEFGGPRQPPSFDEKTGYHY